MNEYQKKLYNDLMTLCEDEDGAFFYKDIDGFTQTYRIFNYRLASYSDFCRPGALECRGIMFEIERRDVIVSYPVRLASMPMEKFFNLHEISSDINNLVEVLISQGRLSRDVFERVKKRDKGKINKN